MGCGLSARLCAEAGEARGALEGWDSCVPRGRRVFLAVRNAASHGRAHGHNHGRATPFPGRCPRPPRTLPTATIEGGPMPFPEGCSFPSQDAAHGHNRRRATPFPGRCPRPSQDAGHGHNRGRAHALPRGLLIPFPGRCPRPQSQEGHALPRTLPTAIMASRGSHRCSKRPSVPKTTVRQAQGGWGPRMGGGANSTKAGWCWDQHPSGLPTPTPWRDPARGGGGCHSGGAPSWLWTGPCGLPVQAGLLQGRCLGVGSSF